MVSCGPDAYGLYNLARARWVSFTPASQCGYSPGFGQGTCQPVAVGSHWVKLVTSEGCREHCGSYYYLQDISTGQLKPDPVTAGGTVFDDLDTPLGSVPLCRPLRYPTSQPADTIAPGPGTLQFSGRFALAEGTVQSKQMGPIRAYRLERCGSRRALDIMDASFLFPPLMSSRAVVSLGSRPGHCKKSHSDPNCAIYYYLRGVYLRGLRQFAAALPHARVPRNSLPAQLVGLTRSTIYVQAPYPGGPLWAATLPAPATAAASAQ